MKCEYCDSEATNAVVDFFYSFSHLTGKTSLEPESTHYFCDRHKRESNTYDISVSPYHEKKLAEALLNKDAD